MRREKENEKAEKERNLRDRYTESSGFSNEEERESEARIEIWKFGERKIVGRQRKKSTYKRTFPSRFQQGISMVKKSRLGERRKQGEGWPYLLLFVLL